jgi:hypothetical protein
MLHDVAEQLVATRHEVVVLTSSGGYVNTEAELSESSLPKFDIRVVRQSSAVPRLINWGWFWIQAVVRVPLMRWDRCLVLTDPPFLMIAGLFSKILHGNSRKMFWWTMDLYPDALAAAGILSPKNPLYWILRQFVEMGLRALDGVIALGPRQHRSLQAYSRWRSTDQFCIVVPPWDSRLVQRPPLGENSVVRRFGWDGLTIALYAGNLGEGHTFTEILEGARWFQVNGKTEWLFVFAVRGSGVAALKVQAAGLPNVIVMDYLPEDETAPLLWSAAVHLISMKPGWEGTIVPSKLYGVIRTEAPVLFIGPEDSDTAEELRRLHRGKVLRSGADGATVAATLQQLGQPAWRATPLTEIGGMGQVAEYICRP